MSQSNRPNRRIGFTDDTRRLLVAIGGAIILHATVFAGAELFSTAERAPAVSEQISVVVTRVNRASHGEGTAAPPTEIQRERFADTEAAIRAETAGVPAATQPTKSVVAPPAKLAANAAEDPAEAPVVKPPTNPPADPPTVPIVDPTPISTAGADSAPPDQREPSTDGEPVSSETPPAALFERASRNSYSGVNPTGSASTAEAIHPDRRYVEPQYPERARRAGVEGIAVVTFEIDQRGRPARIALQESSGSSLLDREAVRAVQLWRFSRTAAGEESVHQIEFRLQEDL